MYLNLLKYMHVWKSHTTLRLGHSTVSRFKMNILLIETGEIKKLKQRLVIV